MAQVYREVESPKLPNFKKAAMVIFGYALVVTTTVSFFAVWLIPDEVRMKDYADNLMGGLAMHVIGPPTACSWKCQSENSGVWSSARNVCVMLSSMVKVLPGRCS